MRPILFILAGVGVAAIVGIIINRIRGPKRAREREREETLSSAEATNDITGVKKDGVLRIAPFGRMVAPIETYVKKRHRYSEANSPDWYELVCVMGNRELLIEWYREGSRVDITAGFEDENPTLKDLGLTEDDLVAFDERAQGEFTWDNANWQFEDSGERFYFEDDGREREGFYAWDFVGRDGRSISVEKWEGDARFYVYHAWRVDPDGVEVFEAGRGR